MSAKVNASAQNRNASSEAPQFFDLHTRGCGYMNRVRWVKPQRNGRSSGKEFLACAINAVHGNMSEPNYSYMDLIVSGEEAIEIVSSLEEASEAKQKIFVAFIVGDIYAHAYTRPAKDSKGKPTGEEEINAIIKGRLLLITHVTINDQVVYQREADASQEATGDEGAEPAEEEQDPAAGQDHDESEAGRDDSYREPEQYEKEDAAPACQHRAPQSSQSRGLPAMPSSRGISNFNRNSNRMH